MRCEWRPETPEEIAEHQRMRRELTESQRNYETLEVDYKGEKKLKPCSRARSVVLMALIALAIFYFISKVILYGCL